MPAVVALMLLPVTYHQKDDRRAARRNVNAVCNAYNSVIFDLE